MKTSKRLREVFVVAGQLLRSRCQTKAAHAPFVYTHLRDTRSYTVVQERPGSGELGP